MRIQDKVLACLSLVVLLGAVCYGATITGTVKAPNGSPFEGAFVEARNTQTKITVSVLSRRGGQYRIPNLPAGEYGLRIRAIGYQAQPRNGVNLTADQNVSFEFALQKGEVRWSDLSLYQGKQLLPEGKGKDPLFSFGPGQPTPTCAGCHGFQTRMASTTRDESGWRDGVNYMRGTMRVAISDQVAEDIVSYLNTVFGEDSTLPKSPADMPEYQKLVRRFTDDSTRIVYVEYEVGGKFPWSAVPDNKGDVWIPYNGPVNKVAKLDPKTGELQDFSLASPGVDRIHSAVPAADGTVWFSEQFNNKIGKLDLNTQKFTEYQAPEQEGVRGGGSTHTIRVDSKGIVWSSGTPLNRFDPQTQTFTAFRGTTRTTDFYGIAIDKDDSVWADELKQDGKLYRVTSTGEQKGWSPPTNGFPRRVQVGPDGMVWLGEYTSGKIARFDPKTETFREYQLPGPQPSPYGIGIDRNHDLWYSSYFMDVIGCLDPKTGKVTEYPFPHSENSIREFFLDDQGHMWYGSPSNNKVGYFYLAD
jgi:virginiamycin B lyase